MWKLVMPRGSCVVVLSVLAVMLITACQGAAAREVPSTGVAPAASPTSPPTSAASPTPQPTPIPSPMPTVEPTLPPIVESGSPNPVVILPAGPEAAGTGDDTSWLTVEPPADMTWQSFVGKIEAKDIALGYELLYPADWFVYSDGGGGSIQTFAQFETPDQAPPGFLDGNMKIDVGFQICAPLSSDNCQLIGTPVVVAGLPGVAQAHKSELTGAEFRAVALQKGYVTLTIAAHIHGEAERVKAYEQILGYMLSTLRVDE